MPTARKMPIGKLQFGIIVPTKTHDRAKMLTGMIGGRISDIYAKGIEEVWAKETGTKISKSKRQEDLDDIARGLPDESIPYLKAMAEFLKSRPDDSDLQMHALMLRKFLPSDFIQNSTVKVEKHG